MAASSKDIIPEYRRRQNWRPLYDGIPEEVGIQALESLSQIDEETQIMLARAGGEILSVWDTRSNQIAGIVILDEDWIVSIGADNGIGSNIKSWKINKKTGGAVCFDTKPSHKDRGFGYFTNILSFKDGLIITGSMSGNESTFNCWRLNPKTGELTCISTTPAHGSLIKGFVILDSGCIVSVEARAQPTANGSEEYAELKCWCIDEKSGVLTALNIWDYQFYSGKELVTLKTSKYDINFAVRSITAISNNRFLIGTNKGVIYCWEIDEKLEGAKQLFSFGEYKQHDAPNILALTVVNKELLLTIEDYGDKAYYKSRIKCWKINAAAKKAECISTWKGYENEKEARFNNIIVLDNGWILSSSPEIKCWKLNKETGEAVPLATWLNGDAVSSLIALNSGWIVYSANTNSSFRIPASGIIYCSRGIEPWLEEVRRLEEEHKKRNLISHDLVAAQEKFPDSAVGVAFSEIWKDCQIDPKEIVLIRRLASGAYGEVWLGDWHSTHIAVKKLKISVSQITKTIREEFKQEAKIMVALKHPNIVQFYGVISFPEQMIILEFMSEGSLYDLLSSKEALSWQLRYNIGLDIAKGLLYLHNKKLMHRDLKSLNVLLSKERQAKIADFGLAELKAESGQTVTCGPVGTMRWMAPELFEPHSKYTYASDIYSMGVIFGELMHRQIPHKDIPNAVIPIWVGRLGNRDPIPKDAPEIMRSSTVLFWAQDQNSRSTAKEALDRLRSLPVTDNAPIPSPHS